MVLMAYIDDANKFLEKYSPKHNLIFSVVPMNSKDLHRPIPLELELD